MRISDWSSDVCSSDLSGLNEGRLNAEVLPRAPQSLAQSTALVPTTTGFLNDDCSAMSLWIFTRDHKAETIASLISAVTHYESSMKQDTRIRFSLASGNVGVMAEIGRAHV